MPVLRITSELRAPVAAGRVRYEDPNFPDRAGWKEIVVTGGDGAVVPEATPKGVDRSKELTAYPQDPLLAPPQDLMATFVWKPKAAPGAVTAETPLPAASVPTAPVPPGQAAAGTVVRGDYLSRLLQQGEIGWGMMLVGMVVAFGLGAIHALSPGPREDHCGGVPGGQPRNPAARAVSGRDGDVHAHHFGVRAGHCDLVLLAVTCCRRRFFRCWEPSREFRLCGSGRCCSSSGCGWRKAATRTTIITTIMIIPTIITIMRRSPGTTIMETAGCTATCRKATSAWGA